MKTITLLSCCLLCACGNWSNKDLEFLNAMPTAEQLRAKVPTGTAAGLSGEGTRRDALDVGTPSKFYADTRAASASFNGILYFLIGALDYVRGLPPTTRSEDARVWGPYDDKDNPGFQFQVIIIRVDETTFSYAFQHRPKGGEFFNTVTGGFKASAQLRRGSGTLVIHAAEAAAKLTSAKGFEAYEKVEMAYVTDKAPVTVVMKFTGKAGQPIATLDYGYQENDDKSGGIGFRAVGTNSNFTQLDTATAWLASGAGFGVLTVIEGNYKGATHFECWDAAFKTTYAKQTWPGGVDIGEAKSCVTVENFPKP